MKLGVSSGNDKILPTKSSINDSNLKEDKDKQLRERQKIFASMVERKSNYLQI